MVRASLKTEKLTELAAAKLATTLEELKGRLYIIDELITKIYRWLNKDANPPLHGVLTLVNDTVFIKHVLKPNQATMVMQQEHVYLNTHLLNTLQQWSASVLRGRTISTSVSGRNSVTDMNEKRQSRDRFGKVAIIYGFPVIHNVTGVTDAKVTATDLIADRNVDCCDLVADDFVIVHERSLLHRLDFERELLDVSYFIPGGARPVGIWYRQVVEVGISAPSDISSADQSEYNLQEIRRNADTVVERACGQYFAELPQFFLGSSGPLVVVSCVRPSMSDASSPPRFENYYYQLTVSGKGFEINPHVTLGAPITSATKNATPERNSTLISTYQDFLQHKIPFRVRVAVRALVKTSDSKRHFLQNIETTFADLQDHFFPTDRSTYFAFQSAAATADEGQQDRRVIIGVEKVVSTNNRSRASSTDLAPNNNSATNVTRKISNTGEKDELLTVLSSTTKIFKPGNSGDLSGALCREFTKFVEETVDVSADRNLKSTGDSKGFYRILDSSRWLEARPLLEGCARWQSAEAGRSPLITIPSKTVIEIPVVLDAVAFVHELTPLKYLPGFLEDAIVRQLNATCYLLKLAVHASTYTNHFTSSSSALAQERAVSVIGSRYRAGSVSNMDGSSGRLSGSDSGEELAGDAYGDDKLFYHPARDDDSFLNEANALRDDGGQSRQDAGSEKLWKQLFDFAPQIGHYFFEQPLCRVFSIVNVPSSSRVAQFINTRLAARLMHSFCMYQNGATMSQTSAAGGVLSTTPSIQPSSLVYGAGLQSNRQLIGNYLVCPHWYVKLPSEVVQTGMLVGWCRGLYTYHHYMHENYNDKGWGCAYRSLQTVWSWLRLNGVVVVAAEASVAAPSPLKNSQSTAMFLPPQHRVIQQTLVSIGDKPQTFVGSKQWIGSMELGYFLNQHYQIECRYLRVESGEEMPSLARQLLHHFESEGCPVMIGGGQLAHTILGVAFRDSDGYCQWLILDPHYTGVDNIDTIVRDGWCGWKETSFWQKQHYYNLCLPRVAKR